MTQIVLPSARRLTRSGLTGASLAALTLALSLAAPARAQSFQGTGTVSSGSASIVNGAGTTDVFVNSSEAIIDWAVAGSGSNVVFQTAGTTATFQTGVSAPISNYTVLNRITPTNAAGTAINASVEFDGTVNSTLFGATGGNVWFYSPNGIIVGATGSFNVGGLVLTTNPIDTTGGLYGPAGQIRFAGPLGNLAPVTVNGSITALANPQAQTPAYVALVAPRVTQAGTVSAEGPVAYVAAEVVDITMNAGLFDIAVTAGTNDSHGVTHTGSTTGPAPLAAGEQRVISMVAVPKNDGLTMLLGGTVGYASTASNDGTAVILAAGHGLGYDGASDPFTNPAGISIGDVDFTSALSARATGTITVAPTDLTLFEWFASLDAIQSVALDMTSGGTIQALATDGVPADIGFPPAGTRYALDVHAGYADVGGAITASIDNGGTFDSAGIVRMDVSGNANTGIASSPNGTGGSITVNVPNGTFTAFQLDAFASGFGATDGFVGGNGTGGTIDMTVGGAVTVGALNVVAEGIGGDIPGGGSSGGTGGDGTGGGITLAANGGALLTNSISVIANGSAGGGDDLGGTGRGGTISATASGGGTIGADTASFLNLDLNANGAGGGSLAQAGDGIGGAVSLTANNGTLDFDNVSLTAVGFGASSSAGQAGSGFGGSAVVNITGTDQSWSFLSVNANSLAGSGTDVGATGGSATGDAIAGAQLNVDGAALTVNLGANVTADAIGTFGFAGAGTATAGSAAVSVRNGGSISAAGALVVSASADFQIDALSSDPEFTPDMNGGTATLTLDNGGISVPNLAVLAYANAIGGISGAGKATGGTASVRVLNNGGLLVDPTLAFSPSGFEALLIDARGTGGISTFIDGQFRTVTDGFANGAQGGIALLQIDSGNVTVLGVPATISATGTGGPGALAAGSGTTAGDGTGGSASLVMNGGTFTATGGLGILATGTGGGGKGGVVAGNGTGGTAVFSQAGGSATLSNLPFVIDAGGFSAAIDPAELATSGNANGGSASLLASGGTLFIDTPLTLSAQGVAGNSTLGIGGDGTGGTVLFDVSGNALVVPTVGALTLQADGSGGDAIGATGFGGRGTGGSATLRTRGNGSLSGGAVAISANGQGGDNTAATASGGQGVGGVTALVAPGGQLFLSGNVTLDASGIAGATPGVLPLATAGFIELGSENSVSGGALTVLGTLTGTARGDVARADGQGLRVRGAVAAVSADGNVTLDVTGQADLALAGNSTFGSNNGNLTITSRRAGITATGDLGSGGDTVLAGNTTVSVGRLLAGGGAQLASTTGDVRASGLVSTTGDTSVVAGGAVALAQVTAGGRLDVTAQTGGVTATGALGGQTATVITSAQDVLLTGATSANALTITSSAGSIRATGGLGTGNGGALALTAQQDIALTTATSDAALNLTTTAGTITATGQLNSRTNLTINGGNGVTLAGAQAGGVLAIDGGTGGITAGGTLRSGAFQGGNGMTLTGQQAITLTSAVSDGALGITSTGGGVSVSGGLTAIQTIDVTGFGAISLNSAGALTGLTITSQTGALTAGTLTSGGGNVAITAPLGIDVTTLSSSGTTGLIASGGPIRIDDLQSTGLITVSGQSVSLTSTGPLAFADADATGGDLSIDSGGNLVLATADATGAVTLVSRTGSLAASGAINGSAVSATAQDALTTGAVTAATTVDLTSQNAAVTSGGAIAADTIRLTAGTDLTTNGPLNGISLIALNAGNSIVTNAAIDPAVLTMTAGNAITTNATAQGGSITLVAGGDIAINADLVATGALDLTAGGTFRLGALASGAQISAASGDIAITTGAALGVRGTTASVALANMGGDAIIGGAPAAGVYNLDSAELGRVFADQRIGFAVPIVSPGVPGTVTVDSLAMTYGGSGQLGSGGTFAVTTPGLVRVTGAVTAATSGASDTLAITANRVDLIAGTGSITMADGTGARGGTLDIAADRLVVATANTVSQLDAAADTAAINTLLDAPAGTPGDTAIDVGNLTVAVGDGIYIQNLGTSSAFADRRGFSADSVAITTGGPATRIVINGQTFDAAGAAVTGLDTVPTITINGVAAAAGGQFDRLSTINGCIIGQSCRAIVVPPPGKPDLTGPLDPGGLPQPFITSNVVFDIEPIGQDLQLPLVDEPVTSVGNEDLWEETCPKGRTGCEGERAR
ncbi:hypothetical protein [Novosphingobium colocasiae]|uniref:Filamentous haemagglutinin FhaB/tRNA nuclease CdiA-like TPS domain-containing protein n=1 Tax=Novosphingobium colocasiae TaxID=1256513 RepID=A0A918UJG7_9SPHN|nr:hypothetical protein [Novosphingobium colocasiae]GGZ14070.1 hypothetical protein GCM10011614_31390 [Novosphingobium colocasiae]